MIAYLSAMLLLNVRKESWIAQISFATGTLIVPRNTRLLTLTVVASGINCSGTVLLFL